MTIKELSEICGVSQQAIRQWCVKNNVSKQRNQGKKPSFYIDEPTKQAIISYYTPNTDECCDNQRNQSNASKTSNTTQATQPLESNETDIVTELTSLLKAEQEHSKHLSEQNTIMLNTIQQQSDIIQQYTVTIQHLTDRLASEQQLHAGSIKALLTEQVKTDEQNISSDDTKSHSDEQIVEEASSKRCSLFSRIFKKNK